MKTITSIGLVLFTLLFSSIYAQIPDKTYDPAIDWNSKNSTDVITIQNGTAVALYITVTVDGNGAGVNIKNCGTTVHIDPGSTAICYTKDPINQVNFSSDKVSSPASGTYIIRQSNY